MKHILRIVNLLALLVAAIFAGPQITFAQESESEIFVDPNQPQIDSLLNVTKPDSPDDVKANNYYRIAYITCNNDTCLKYCKLTLDWCKPTDSLMIANTYNKIGYAYYMKDETRKALENRFKAADLYNKISDKKNEAVTFMSIGKFYEDLNIKDSIFYYYNKALRYFTETQDTARIISLYFGLGSAYVNMSLYSSAEETYRKALGYAELSKDTLKMAYCYSEMGGMYVFQSDTLPYIAISLLKKSVQLYELANLIKYSDISDKYYVYGQLANAYIVKAKQTGKKAYADSCYIYIKKLGNYFLSIGSYFDYIQTRHCYVEYLVFYKRYREALAELLKLEKYVTDNSSIFILADYNKWLYHVYYLLGDYKNALDCHCKYIDYKMAYVNDSTLNVLKDAEVQRTQMLDSVNHRFETLRIETEHQQELTRTRLRTRVLLSIALVFILVGIIMFFFYKTTKENEENKLRNKALEVERSLLRTQMNPHFIFNALNSVQSFILNSNAPEAVRFLSKFAKLMRMILNNSMVQSVTLADEMQSLSLYLDLERARFDNKFNYSIDISGNIDEDLVHVPPMLVQPFIENAIIHGIMHKTDGEGLITIKITANDADSIICQITDNGVGRKMAAELEKNNERKHKSVGMQLTRDRLRDLNNEANAKMSCVITDLEDETGNALGTQVTVIIPMVEETKAEG